MSMSPMIRPSVRRGLLAAAVSLSAATAAYADSTPGYVTISMSGSTAMRNFITGGSTSGNADSGLTLLPNGQTITLQIGPTTTGAVTIDPGLVPASRIELAPLSYYDPTAPGNDPTNSANATYGQVLRVEWREQGSVEGIQDLANSWNSTGVTWSAGSGSSGPNTPIWVNRNKLTSNTSSTTDGHIGTTWVISQQNKVQIAVSDVTTAQGFRTNGAGTIAAQPGAAGYGQGNPNAAVVEKLADPSIFDGIDDGGLGNAGVEKTNNTLLCNTATLFTANPGTGLSQLNQTDAKWLETTGRLANGATFNMTTRDTNSGTRNVAALNTGVDPSWAVGMQDGGASGQKNLGDMKFSNKVSGGDLKQTLQINRMAVGTLSNADALNSTRINSANPLRALRYSDSADGSVPYVLLSVRTLTDGTYVIFQNETLVTLKTGNTTQYPSGIMGDDQTGSVQNFINNLLQSVQGFPNPTTLLTPADDLLAKGYMLPQLMQRIKTADGTSTVTGRSYDIQMNNPNVDMALLDILLNDPAASTYRDKFYHDDPAQVTAGGTTTNRYGAPGSAGTSIILTAPTATTGNYMFGNYNQNGIRDFAAFKTAVFASLALEASGHGNSALTGDSTNSTIDWAGFVAVHSEQLAAANVNLSGLQAMVGQSGTGIGANKGDLIVMGDYDGDGVFNGRDLYLMARGTTLANSTSVDALSGDTFDNMVRDASKIIRKNDALDFLQQYASTSLKQDARVTQTLSAAGSGVPAAPAGATVLSVRTSGSGTSAVTSVVYTFDAGAENAFNKGDVDRDGMVDFNDAVLVDKFAGQSYRNIDQQLAAAYTTPGGIKKNISLVDVQMIDGAASIGAADLAKLSEAMNAGHGGPVHWYAGTLNKTGGGAMVFARSLGTVAIEAGASFTISGGKVVVNGTLNPFKDNTLSTPGVTSSTGNLLAVRVESGGMLQVGGGIKEAGSVTAGGHVKVESSTNGHNMLVAASLVVAGTPTAPTGKITLGDRADLVVKAGYTADQVRQLIQAGYADGGWNGNGLTLASAAAGQALAYISGDAYTALKGQSQFDGWNIAASDLLIKVTWQGDADLSGQITLDDYAQLDAAFLLHASHPQWSNGDFNYDGIVNWQDYALIDSAFAQQGDPLATELIAAHSAAFGLPYATTIASLQAAAPEPASLGLLAAGVAGILLRRRSR